MNLAANGKSMLLVHQEREGRMGEAEYRPGHVFRCDTCGFRRKAFDVVVGCSLCSGSLRYDGDGAFVCDADPNHRLGGGAG